MTPDEHIEPTARYVQIGWYEPRTRHFNRLWELGPKAGAQPVYIRQVSFDALDTTEVEDGDTDAGVTH